MLFFNKKIFYLYYLYYLHENILYNEKYYIYLSKEPLSPSKLILSKKLRSSMGK